MINKKSLWFLTLFSLILVLSVYYITMPSEMLINNQDNNKDEGVVVVSDGTFLTALRVEANDKLLQDLNDLRVILTNIDATVEEKNNAFEKMKLLNINKGNEEALENKILEEFKLNSFVKIDGDQIRIVVASDKHDNTVANNIMRSVQNQFEKKMYITVKFQK